MQCLFGQIIDLLLHLRLLLVRHHNVTNAQTYAHLRRLGFIVNRFKPALREEYRATLAAETQQVALDQAAEYQAAEPMGDSDYTGEIHPEESAGQLMEIEQSNESFLAPIDVAIPFSAGAEQADGYNAVSHREVHSSEQQTQHTESLPAEPTPDAPAASEAHGKGADFYWQIP